MFVKIIKIINLIGLCILSIGLFLGVVIPFLVTLFCNQKCGTDRWLFIHWIGVAITIPGVFVYLLGQVLLMISKRLPGTSEKSL
jgi:ABC-type tungstate transport system substrate-binding protein